MKSHRRRPLRWRSVLCALLLGSMGTGALAEEIVVEADVSELDPATGQHVLSGNVIATQGPMTLKADKVTLTTVENKITQIIASGQPAEMTGEEGFVGQANTINYDAVKEIAVFDGKAFVKRGEETMSGEHITANLKTDYLLAKGKGESRVRLTFSNEE